MLYVTITCNIKINKRVSNKWKAKASTILLTQYCYTLAFVALLVQAPTKHRMTIIISLLQSDMWYDINVL